MATLLWTARQGPLLHHEDLLVGISRQLAVEGERRLLESNWRDVDVYPGEIREIPLGIRWTWSWRLKSARFGIEHGPCCVRSATCQIWCSRIKELAHGSSGPLGQRVFGSSGNLAGAKVGFVEHVEEMTGTNKILLHSSQIWFMNVYDTIL